MAENLFFIRFSVILFWWILPTLLISSVLLNLFFFDKKRIFINNKIFDNISPYTNILHKCFFIFFWILFIFTTIYCLYCSISVLIFRQIKPYSVIWDFSEQSNVVLAGSNSKDIENAFFHVYIVCSGYCIHLVNVWLYSYFYLTVININFLKELKYKIKFFLFKVF